MKRIFALMAMLLMLHATAGASGLAGLAMQAGDLPDPADILGIKPVLYEKDVQVDGVFYTAYTFPMPEDDEGFLCAYSAAAQREGYTVSAGTVLDRAAWMISAGVMKAWIVPDFRGSMLFLVHTGLGYTPLPTPTPSPTPKPTRTPAPEILPEQTAPVSGGHWETVEARKDCTECVGGTCDICDGSGWYRLYGERVPCSVLCPSCDGKGYWVVCEMVWVP